MADEQAEPILEFIQRVVDLLKDDKPLHDAALRLLTATAESQEFDLAQKMKRASK